ncbi:MAG: SulP family inorganic anion transporter [bacterium]|nr:SulP family inorganic anion transporter [bacterium]
MTNAESVTGLSQKLKTIFRILDWLPRYKLSFLSMDLIAGITLASFVLPESLAYANLAGVPPQYGIYCIIAGGLLFAIFTSTKQVVIGPTSAISLMVGSTIALMADGDLQRWAAIASLTALVIFVLCIISYLLHLSSLVSFISESILLGFKAGAAITIISTQLPKLFGIHISGTNFFSRIANLSNHLNEMHLTVFLFGLAAFIILRLGQHFFSGWPVSLIVVIVAICLISFTGLSQQGFELLGLLPNGLPPLGRPSLRFTDVDGILGLALGCFLMGYVETMAAAKTFAEKHNYNVNARQELLALGFANFGAALASGFPVAGGLSQSTVNDKSGAKTPLALIFCSFALVIILLYFTHLIQNLPEVVLAAVVIDAVMGLIKVKSLKQLYNLSKPEFLVALIAVAGVLTFGILKGVLIASLISIVFVIAKSKMPYIAVLGKIPGTLRFSDIKRNPDNTEITSIRILRVESSIVYYNEENVHELLLSHTLWGADKIRLVILDLSAASNIDVSGAHMLLKFSTELKEQNIQFKIVEALATARDMLRKLGLEEITGHISRRDSIENEVEEFQKLQTASK